MHALYDAGSIFIRKIGHARGHGLGHEKREKKNEMS